MANTRLFKSAGSVVPADTYNAAGGLAYKLSHKAALAQYAATGCLNNVFYATAEQQLSEMLKLCKDVEPAFIAKTAVYCRESGYMKDAPALLAAVLASQNFGLLERVFSRVINDGRMLRNFVQIVRSGVTGRKSFGSAPKRLIRQWLETRTDDQIFKASVGNSPSLRDVIRMVHPHPKTTSREALYGYIVGLDGTDVVSSDANRRVYNRSVLPPLVQAFEAWKKNPTASPPDVPFLMLAGLELLPAQWTQIAKDASWQTTRMNLNTFMRHDVFDNQAVVQLVAQRLVDPNEIKRSRVFPYQLLAAYVNTLGTVPSEISNALQSAMEIAIDNVPAIDGKVYVLVDVSGSMDSPVTGVREGATSKVRCVDVAALMAAAVLRRNKNAEVIPFNDDVVRATLNPYDSVMTNAMALTRLVDGGTNCSSPLRALNHRNAMGDVCIFVSDNQSWIDTIGWRMEEGTTVRQEWQAFKRRNRQAKLVCIDLQPYANTQAVGSDVLNCGGFSDTLFSVVADFVSGTLDGDAFVKRIEAVEI